MSADPDPVVALCERVADTLKAELKLPNLQVDWVPVTAANRFELLQQGKIDASCGTDTPPLERRASVDFSIPIFMAGIGAVMRIDVLMSCPGDRPPSVTRCGSTFTWPTTSPSTMKFSVRAGSFVRTTHCVCT